MISRHSASHTGKDVKDEDRMASLLRVVCAWRSREMEEVRCVEKARGDVPRYFIESYDTLTPAVASDRKLPVTFSVPLLQLYS